MAQVAARALQQKDNLCGPFCASRILGIDQDLIAQRAGTRLPLATGEPSVPRGAQTLADYRYELPRVAGAESGTSAAGLIRAMESLSQGRLACVPVRGAWTAERVTALVDRRTSLGARMIANVRTGKLWGSRPSAGQILAALRGDEADPPPPEWDVGHFVELKMVVHVTSGSLVVVHDTYPSLGLDGFHLQPPGAVAAALMRGDGREGGVIAVGPKQSMPGVTAVVEEIGLEVGTWDNGSRS